MPDNQDNNSMDNMSINEINELYEDTIETPDEYRFLALGVSRNYDLTSWQIGGKGNYYIPGSC